MNLDETVERSGAEGIAPGGLADAVAPAHRLVESVAGAQGVEQGLASVCLTYWPYGGGGFGHIGIGIGSEATVGYSTADPKVAWHRRLFGAAAGRVEDDRAAHTSAGQVEPHRLVWFIVSEQQARAMVAEIARRAAQPGRYNLIFNNCDAFVETVLVAGGLSGVAGQRDQWTDRLWQRALIGLARAIRAMVKGRSADNDMSRYPMVDGSLVNQERSKRESAISNLPTKLSSTGLF